MCSPALSTLGCYYGSSHYMHSRTVYSPSSVDIMVCDMLIFITRESDSYSRSVQRISAAVKLGVLLPNVFLTADNLKDIFFVIILRSSQPRRARFLFVIFNTRTCVENLRVCKYLWFFFFFHFIHKGNVINV